MRQKTMLAAVVFALPGICLAEAKPKDDACLAGAAMAREIMAFRQSGGSATELIKAVRAGGQTPATNLYEVFVEKAFALPRFETEEARRLATTDFENDFYMLCRRAM